MTIFVKTSLRRIKHVKTPKGQYFHEHFSILFFFSFFFSFFYSCYCFSIPLFQWTAFFPSSFPEYRYYQIRFPYESDFVPYDRRLLCIRFIWILLEMWRIKEITEKVGIQERNKSVASSESVKGTSMN